MYTESRSNGGSTRFFEKRKGGDVVVEDAALFSCHFTAMLPAACQSLVVEAGLWRLVVALRSTSIQLIPWLIHVAFFPPWGGRIYESMFGLNETGEQLLLSVTSDIFERTRAVAVALLVESISRGLCSVSG